MPISKRIPFSIVVLVTALLLAGACGSSKEPTSEPTSSSPGTPSPQRQSAATGEIPEDQGFLVFRNSAAHYSIKYPKGWARRGSGGDVTFQDKGNVIHIVVDRGTAPSPASVKEELQMLQETNLGLRFRQPHVVRLGSQRAVKAVYTTRGTPTPVTRKPVTLTVDRYELAKGGRRAIVDLGAPKGVENVDAYRVISLSFRWR